MKTTAGEWFLGGAATLGGFTPGFPLPREWRIGLGWRWKTDCSRI